MLINNHFDKSPDQCSRNAACQLRFFKAFKRHGTRFVKAQLAPFPQPLPESGGGCCVCFELVGGLRSL